MNQYETMQISDEQRRSDYLKMSAESRRLREAFPDDKPRVRNRSKFLVTIRKELLYLWFTLGSRLNQVREMRLGYSPQNNPEGCE